jgi:hypothetical protein
MSNVYSNMNFAKDECYTTKSEAEKLCKYLTDNKMISKDLIIWMPFDNELSNIYKSFEKNGYKIELSNLELGLDFYNYEPKKWDIIITNPPFSKRTNLMKRLVGFGKPFIILQATQFFNNQFCVNMLSKHDFKFILPSCRMNFLTYNKEKNRVISSKNGTAFYSFWLCHKIGLSKIFNKLENSGKESDVEEYQINGNVIEESHMNLFNL